MRMRARATLAIASFGGAGVRQHLHHLGQAQQSGEAHDLDRDVPFGEGLLQQEEQPRGAAQDGDVRPPGNPRHAAPRCDRPPTAPR
jgi:hypothetical protein